ncbi:MAG: hypothetical protein CMJ65_06030 [Planctomycetaceae bacterium]|nr:hypothetical protein [Planctomycetaceae bacterium]
MVSWPGECEFGRRTQLVFGGECIWCAAGTESKTRCACQFEVIDRCGRSMTGVIQRETPGELIPARRQES